MEQKYKDFLNYDFTANEQYRPYMDSLYPPPPLTKIPHYKKKFYKQYVDHDFDVNYDPEKREEKPSTAGPAPSEEQKEKPAEENAKKSEEEEKKTDSPQAHRKALPWITKLQMMLFTVFLFTFPVGLVARSFYHGIPLALAYVIALLKKYGMPKFQKIYWQSLLMDEHTHNLIGAVVCIMSFSSTVIVWFPQILRAVLFLAESLHFMANNGNKMAKLVDGISGKVSGQKESLLSFKADLEVYTGFYLIVALLTGWVSLVLPLFYWQVMQIRYLMSGYSRQALDKLAYQMDWLISHPSCPLPFKWILKGLRTAGSYMAKMGQPQPEAAPQH